MSKRSIVLVDDEPNILSSIKMYFEHEGYIVRTYSTAEAALDGIDAEQPSIAVFDIIFHKSPMQGHDLFREVRSKYNFPVIFLTSKGFDDEQEQGLDLGADDYVTKPFSHKVPGARVRAVLRRSQLDVDVRVNKPRRFRHSNGLSEHILSVDEARGTCSWIRQSVNLTVAQMHILLTLASDPGRLRSRTELLSALRRVEGLIDRDDDLDERTIDQHVKRMRKRFRDVDPAAPDVIETSYGQGYRLNVTEVADPL